MDIPEGIHTFNILFIFFIPTTLFIIQILVYKPKHGDDFTYGPVRGQRMMCLLIIVIFETDNFYCFACDPGSGSEYYYRRYKKKKEIRRTII